MTPRSGNGVFRKPAIILAFHTALLKRKYSKLYSNQPKKIPVSKAKDQELIDLAVLRTPRRTYRESKELTNKLELII
jgi:hypothetical protein